jgi:hypothetical protein
MALGWLWLLSPFVVIALVAHDAELRKWVTTHYDGCRVAGWMGVAMMFAGAGLASALIGTLMFVFGTPLVGLIAFLRPDGEDEGGGGNGDPHVPPIDWDEFERSFWGHVRRGRLPRLPRTPTRV